MAINPLAQDPGILGLIFPFVALWENDDCKSDCPGRVWSQEAKHCKLLWKHFTTMIWTERWQSNLVLLKEVILWKCNTYDNSL